MTHTIILGGGIAGLTAAWQLHQLGRSFTLYEASDRLGGTVRTLHRNGFVLEQGPDGWVTEKTLGRRTRPRPRPRPPAHPLARRRPRHLDPPQRHPPPHPRRHAHDGLHQPRRPRKLTPALPHSPRRLRRRARTRRRASRRRPPPPPRRVRRPLRPPPLRPRGPRHPRRPAPLRSLRRRRPQALRPRRHARLRPDGARPRLPHPRPPGKEPSRARRPAHHLHYPPRRRPDPRRHHGRHPPPGSVHLNTPITSVRPAPTPDLWRWTVQTGHGPEHCDHLILATPAHVTRRLLPKLLAKPPGSSTVWHGPDGNLHGQAMEVHGQIPGPHPAESAPQLLPAEASSALLVTFAFDESFQLPAGFGFLVPQGEGSRLLAATFVDQKFPHRAPPGKRLLRAFFGGAEALALDASTDEALATLAFAELEKILGPLPSPAFHHVQRWPRSLPQYEVGHQARIAELTTLLPQPSTCSATPTTA